MGLVHELSGPTLVKKKKKEEEEATNVKEKKRKKSVKKSNVGEAHVQLHMSIFIQKWCPISLISFFFRFGENFLVG